MEIALFFGFVNLYFLFHFMYIGRWSLEISLGPCCRHSGEFPQGPNCWSSCNVWRKMKEGEVYEDKGMVNDVKGVRNLGGKKMLSWMREWISVCVVVMLMVVVALIVLMIVARVVCLGAVKVDWLFRSGWHLRVGLGFCGDCGGSGTGSGVCCEANPVMFEWERVCFVTF